MMGFFCNINGGIMIFMLWIHGVHQSQDMYSNRYLIRIQWIYNHQYDMLMDAHGC